MIQAEKNKLRQGRKTYTCIAAKITRNKKINLRQCIQSTAYYPSVYVAIQHSQSYVRKLFEIFIPELIKNPIKQQSLAQSVFFSGYSSQSQIVHFVENNR